MGLEVPNNGALTKTGRTTTFLLSQACKEQKLLNGKPACAAPTRPSISKENFQQPLPIGCDEPPVNEDLQLMKASS